MALVAGGTLNYKKQSNLILAKPCNQRHGHATKNGLEFNGH